MSSTTVRARQEESLRRARELGRRDAETFALRLERQEQQERETRLARLAWRPRRREEEWADGEASLRVVQLEGRIHELNSYVQAVESSTPWRVIQWVRRLFGRAW
jgi:uncharacterized protein involved in type VI secretion and phage assembly